MKNLSIEELEIEFIKLEKVYKSCKLVADKARDKVSIAYKEYSSVRKLITVHRRNANRVKCKSTEEKKDVINKYELIYLIDNTNMGNVARAIFGMEQSIDVDRFKRKIINGSIYIGNLKARNVQLFFKRHEGRTYESLGEEFGISKTRASQIYGSVLKNFKHPRLGRMLKQEMPTI